MKSIMKAIWRWLRKPSHVVDKLEFLMTLAILVVILLELVAGNRQLAALKSLENDVAVQAKTLAVLTRTEDSLLSSMKQTNKELRSSLAISKEASGAMRSQLVILEAEQRARLAQAAKKPLIRAKIGDFIVGGPPDTPIKIRRLTLTSAVFDLTVTNTGTSSLLHGELTVNIEGPDVSLSCARDCVPVPIPQPQEVSARWHSFDILLGRRIGPDTSVLMTMTLSFPKGHLPFLVFFSVDADNYPMTRLGSIRVGPPRE
jgi:cell division protein FtsB